MSVLLSTNYMSNTPSPSASPTAIAPTTRTESRLFTHYGIPTPSSTPSPESTPTSPSPSTTSNSVTRAATPVLNAEALPFVPRLSIPPKIVQLAEATNELFEVHLPGNRVYRIGMKNGRYHGYGEVFENGVFRHAGVWHERKGFLSEYPRRINP